jgi:hypothetical protein
MIGAKPGPAEFAANYRLIKHELQTESLPQTTHLNVAKRLI